MRGLRREGRDDAVTDPQEFDDLRPWLFAIAYRMLGSVADAEDAIQDTWMRVADAEDEPASLKAYLSVVLSRVCIDMLRSARRRRETYVGPWIPEPLPTGVREAASYEDPERSAELKESISIAALLLLERLSPLERASYVLHDVFGFGYGEIAEVVGRSAVACRQLASRARVHMATGMPRYDADAAQRWELAGRLFEALRDGEIDALRTLLAVEVAAVNDSAGEAGGTGGTFTADRIARILIATVPRLLRTGARFDECELNGQPGAILRDPDDRVVGTWTLDIRDGAICAIHSVTSPEKLSHLGETGDVHALRAMTLSRAARARPTRHPHGRGAARGDAGRRRRHGRLRGARRPAPGPHARRRQTLAGHPGLDAARARRRHPRPHAHRTGAAAAGLMIALVGAPYFVWLLRRGRD